MNYWLLALPRPDLDQCLKIGTYGATRHHQISKVQVGDQLAFCATKQDWKIIATGQATTDYYTDEKSVFLNPGLFEHRFDFSARRLVQEPDLMTFIDELDFVTNLAYWSVYFRNNIIQLGSADWELITSKTRSAAQA